MTVTPPRLGRALLRLTPLGEDRADVSADLLDVFRNRVAARGAAYARRRYLRDVLSLWVPASGRRSAAATPSPPAFSGFSRDVIHALRLARRRPAAVATAILGLAIGIAVCGAVFSVLNAVALRPFGIADPATFVRVFRTQTNGISTSWPYASFVDMRDHARLVTLEAWVSERLPLETTAEQTNAPLVGVLFVSPSYFTSLGGAPAQGRVLTAVDDSTASAPTVVLSHTFWTRHFAADSSVVGRRIRLGGTPVTVVGVAAADFTGASEQPPALWAALSAYGDLVSAISPFTPSSRNAVTVGGRLAVGASMEQAEAELTSLSSALPDNGAAERYTGARVVNIDQRFAGADRDGPLLAAALVLGVVGLVLLLACGNVANLLLASASARQHEMGVRFALGASRRRVIRQLLTESLLLASTAGVLGLLLTLWMVPVLGTFIGLPPTIDARPDLRVYTFLFVVSGMAGVFAGLAPARAGTRTNLVGTIRGDHISEGRVPWWSRSRSFLVGTQAAGSLLVLVLAVIMGRAAARAATVDTGMATDRLVTITPVPAIDDAGLDRAGYDSARVADFWQSVQGRVAALPSVEDTSLVQIPPFSGFSMTAEVAREGRRHTVFLNHTAANYFSAIGLRIIRGRTYTVDEVRTGAPVVVISETAARDFWGDEDPLGGTLERIGTQIPNATVIGIVTDAIVARLSQYQTAAVYRPLSNPVAARLIVRAPNPARLVRAIQDIVRDIDPALRPQLTLIEDGVIEERRVPATIATLAGSVATIAVGLSVIGLLGVTAFTVTRRQREVAVRMAIGATGTDVIRLLLRDCLRPVMIGLVAGTLLAWIAGRMISGTIFGVSPTDPLSIAGALVLLSLSAGVAVVVPTRRAVRADAASVLRQA